MLDRNTDLTEDRLFHNKTNTFMKKSTYVVEKLYKLLGIHTFYLFNTSTFDSNIKMCLAKSGLFLNDIDKQLYEYYSDTNKHCDCCGRIMNSWLNLLDPIKYPKRFENTDICQECNKQFDKNSIFYSNSTLRKILNNIVIME